MRRYSALRTFPWEMPGRKENFWPPSARFFSEDRRSSAHQLPVDGRGGSLARAHGQDHRGRAGDRVAAGVDARPGGQRPCPRRPRCRPSGLVSRPSVVDLISGLGEVPMRHDHAVHGQLELAALHPARDGGGRDASGSPSSISMQRDARHAALIVAGRISTRDWSGGWKMMPSSLACSTSSARAGSSASVRR